jgi:hypothetical protein
MFNPQKAIVAVAAQITEFSMEELESINDMRGPRVGSKTIGY